MWILQKDNCDERKYIVYDRSQYVVGRFGTDIVINRDSSISRNHATIYIKGSQLILEDKNSKYGTYYNAGISTNLRLKSDERVVLSSGDRVRFGVLKCIWTFSQQQVHTLASAMSAQQQQTLKSYMHILGGTVEEQPSLVCTHLTMPECSFTPKLLYALIKNIPVVTCEFWKEMVNAIKEERELPEAKKFQPKSSDFDLEPRSERSCLFAKHVFVFLDKDMLQTYKTCIEAAGGGVAELQDSYKKQVMQSGVIVIEYLATSLTQNSQLFNEVSNFLRAQGRRCIPEYEIALAIMHCNTEKWCNVNELCTQSSEEKNVNAPLMVPETEENESSMPIMRVTESVTDSASFSSTQNVKRKHEQLIKEVSDDEEELVALAKRPHTTVSKCEIRPLSPTPLEIESSPLYIKGIRGSNLKVVAEDCVEQQKIKPIKSTTESKLRLKNRNQEASEPKRARINIITDDDDFDDLFNFGSCRKSVQQKVKIVPRVTGDVQLNKNGKNGVNLTDDNLFDFATSSQKVCNQHTQEKRDTENRSPKSKEITQFPAVTPKELTKGINTSGWLSCTKFKKLANDTDSPSESVNGMKTRVFQIKKDDHDGSLNDAENHLNLAATNSTKEVVQIMKNTKVFKKCQPAKSLERNIIVCHHVKDWSCKR